nr:helix-turn-helix domain-containing protein [Conexibacter arvalis]
MLDAVLDAVGRPAGGAAVAGRAHFSRFHFDRLVAAGAGEPPATLRRRVLLERAAWQLLQGATVTDAGIDAGYGSTEAFSRAFARLHGIAPSRFASARGDFRVAAPNGIHFHPPAGLVAHARDRNRDSTRDHDLGSAADRGSTRHHHLGDDHERHHHLGDDHERGRCDDRHRGPDRAGGVHGSPTRGAPDGLTDRMLEHDRWLTGRLIERAALLTDDQLDRELRPGHVVLSFDGPEPSARAMLDRLVWTKEVWTAAIGGTALPPAGDRTIAALRTRFAAAGDAFVALARRIAERGQWDDLFVDALCDPPQSFTFGGAVAHVLTFSAHRREVLAGVLAELDGREREPGCPLEWERARVAPAPRAAAELRGTT